MEKRNGEARKKGSERQGQTKAADSSHPRLKNEILEPCKSRAPWLALIMYQAMAIFACLLASSSQAIPPNTEFVLPEGMVITASNPNGTITITAGHGTERIFSGPGWKKERNLIPRDTRWYGSFGLYDPAESFSPFGRLLVDEGRLFFHSESETLKYLDEGSTYFKPVFNNRGLVVGYHVENMPGGEPTRSVQIWQIYINGQRPQSLRGADDTAVTVKRGNILDTAKPYPASIGAEMSFGDKEYIPEARKANR